MNLNDLIKKEGWDLGRENGVDFVIAEGQRFPKVHPAAIHLKLYRTEARAESKFRHMVSAHHYLWPTQLKTWNYWTERRFFEHCSGWNYITQAGGASTGKSFDAAKIALLFWFANPRNRTVLVASTTLESLNSRIWGYATKLAHEMAVDIPFIYMRGAPPKILFRREDTIHGMFAVAAKRGADTDAISSWIGRHPNEGMLLILDEGTDLPTSLLSALPNLESGLEVFQCMAIGNSLSKFDLHGALSTPKDGWQSIDPLRDTKWETTQKNGICLFFSCYDSPAIHETDPEKKKALSKFLITEDEIDEKKRKYGPDSDSFYRFVLGFWKVGSTDDVVLSMEFVEPFGVMKFAEWLGITPLTIVGGLDPAFSTGGDQCILRLAVLGQDVSGKIVLDYRGDELLFRIPISATSKDAAEIQIGNKVLEILAQFSCPLSNICIDANGQGRALSSVLLLQSKQLKPPIKIYQTKVGNAQVNSFDVIIKTAHEMWFTFRDFIQHHQIRGLDTKSVMQLTSRKVIKNAKTFKPELEPKQEYRARMGAVAPILAHSPDEADSAALALQSAIINFGFRPNEIREIPATTSFIDEKMRAYEALRKKEYEEVKQKGKPNLVANFTGEITSASSPFSKPLR